MRGQDAQGNTLPTPKSWLETPMCVAWRALYGAKDCGGAGEDSGGAAAALGSLASRERPERRQSGRSLNQRPQQGSDRVVPKDDLVDISTGRRFIGLVIVDNPSGNPALNSAMRNQTWRIVLFFSGLSGSCEKCFSARGNVEIHPSRS